MLGRLKRLARLALLTATTAVAVAAISACCGGSSTKNAGATAKCKTNSISAENCQNCCKAYGASTSSYTGRSTCTCR